MRWLTDRRSAPGDGIMAIFGAPTALEDHAIRACLAALDIQNETERLTAHVNRRDGITLQVRVGLNSGAVIAGEIGSGALGYTAIGDQVGVAQRMESVAPPGGVMLSESTARLVEPAAILGESEMLHIKGVEEAVPARRLVAVAVQPGQIGRSDTTLVGRKWELNTVMAEVLRLTQTAIELADSDSVKGNLGIIESPLAWALVWRGVARWCLGHRGWREDFDQAVAIARQTDPIAHATVVAYKYFLAIMCGVIVADDPALRDMDEALEIAETSGDDNALAVTAYALLHGGSPDRQRGLALLAKVRDSRCAGRSARRARQVPGRSVRPRTCPCARR